MAELPFEDNYYLNPEGEAKENVPEICWFVQREVGELLREKGLPDYLELKEESMMFLK